MIRALDLFSAAAGGWTLGLHRAGFVTVAACEIIEWRRILYAENNPHVRLYEDVRSLTATRLVSDLGFLPDIIVGSPPCQDISAANTHGRGIDGDRSGLYLEAIRLVGDCRPRWFAFENSSNLRTRGADRLLAALEALGYACEPCVVGANNVGANHVRKRSWLLGYDPGQLAGARIAIPTGRPAAGRRIGCPEGDEGIGPVRPVPRAEAADPDGDGRDDEWRWRWRGVDISAADDPSDAAPDGCRSRRPGRLAQPASGSCEPPCRDDAHADEAGQPDGRMESGLRSAEIADHGRCDERCDDVADADGDGQPDGTIHAEMGGCEGAGVDAAQPWADWNGGLAHHLWLDDGLSAWVAGTRVAIGDGKRTSAASLIVEAFGDAVLPQIPEAIGRAILRTEAALDLVLGRGAITIPGDR